MRANIRSARVNITNRTSLTASSLAVRGMVTGTRPHALARELRQIADILEQSDPDDRINGHDQDSLTADLIRTIGGRVPSDDLSKVAEIIYTGRRFRDKVLGVDLFGEAAWDILLDLYISESRGRRVSLKSAAIASAAPPTTAHRWLAILEERGLVVRCRDLADARRIYIRLTQTAVEKMTAILRKRAEMPK
ncbi:MarR family winged helix-turn-helix transcriptional regulator [Novosphingobium album (ex Liu et al. 2023)]|uniref:MarR family winged helix-turn-helix transcriptional regulator n=1 Tax=Novosphingobium album (ex Liu et al. 2023) TaxID=3031130 RepID=A0ABT5WMD4_9SPHN|nr:MarR family winged helix-turn-helix transcriptional regulator [Novosphingobium album (ex Liu et al. 2023)]MDE8651201.1 MarR family winged helix-turn-helix transcriptional regulator [Novosphingobium album (ex Liu et al. 2023)]